MQKIEKCQEGFLRGVQGRQIQDGRCFISLKDFITVFNLAIQFRPDLRQIKERIDQRRWHRPWRPNHVDTAELQRITSAGIFARQRPLEVIGRRLPLLANETLARGGIWTGRTWCRDEINKN